jgi:hypothetical protein
MAATPMAIPSEDKPARSRRVRSPAVARRARSSGRRRRADSRAALWPTLACRPSGVDDDVAVEHLHAAR